MNNIRCDPAADVRADVP